METKPPDPAAVDAAMKHAKNRPRPNMDSACDEYACPCHYQIGVLADACEHYRQQLAAARARAEWSEATVTHSLTAEVVDRIVKNHRRWAAYARILAKAHSGALKREYTEQAAEMERDAAALENQEGNADGR